MNSVRSKQSWGWILTPGLTRCVILSYITFLLKWDLTYTEPCWHRVKLKYASLLYFYQEKEDGRLQDGPDFSHRCTIPTCKVILPLIPSRGRMSVSGWELGVVMWFASANGIFANTGPAETCKIYLGTLKLGPCEGAWPSLLDGQRHGGCQYPF